MPPSGTLLSTIKFPHQPVAQADLQASAEPQFSTLRQSASRLLGQQSPFRSAYFTHHQLARLLDIATKMREIISVNGTSRETACWFFSRGRVARFLGSPHLVMFGTSPTTDHRPRTRSSAPGFRLHRPHHADIVCAQSARPVARSPTRAGRYACSPHGPGLPCRELGQCDLVDASTWSC